MRKPLLSIIAVAVLFTFTCSTVEATPFKSKEPKVLTIEETNRLKEIEEKVLEIKEMDLSVLSKEERKELSYELKSMEKEAKAMRGSGLYISTGALIVIIILLIILL